MVHVYRTPMLVQYNQKDRKAWLEIEVGGKKAPLQRAEKRGSHEWTIEEEAKEEKITARVHHQY